jgi:HSP20 family protein
MNDTAKSSEGKVEVQRAKPVKAEAQDWPWYPLTSLRKEIDRLFDDFSRGFGGFSLARRAPDWETWWPYGAKLGATAPAVDLVEKDDEYQITAELPGIDEKNVDVTLSDDVLTIRGEKKEEKEEKKKDYYLSERRYGSFERTFRLPDSVDRDKIQARFEKGVLAVTLPKTPAAAKKQKKIEVKAA